MHLTCDGADPLWSQAMEPLRDIYVLFADNHPLTVSGLKSAVAAQSDIHVLAECVDRKRLRDSVRAQSPHILFVSSEFLEDQLDDLTQLMAENNGTKVILLTSREDPGFFEDALRCGASGIVERQRPIEFIPLAIRRVMSGGFWFEQNLAERMLGDVLQKKEKTRSGEHKIEEMTPSDRQILELVCEGMRNKQIATRLQVSKTTVSRRVTALSRKLQVEDRTALVIYAIKQRLVSL